MTQRILPAEHHRKYGNDKDENACYREQQDDGRKCSLGQPDVKIVQSASVNVLVLIVLS